MAEYLEIHQECLEDYGNCRVVMTPDGEIDIQRQGAIDWEFLTNPFPPPWVYKHLLKAAVMRLLEDRHAIWNEGNGVMQEYQYWVQGSASGPEPSLTNPYPMRLP